MRLEGIRTLLNDGTKPLDVTAKNEASGGSFCVGGITGWRGLETRDRRLIQACGGVAGCDGGKHLRDVRKMAGSWRERTDIWRHGGGRWLALMGERRTDDSRVLNGVLNEALNGCAGGIEKSAPKYPFGMSGRRYKMVKKWGWEDSWVDKWVDKLNKHRPL